MKAIIIGGGIGGLTAAIAFKRVGIEADVYEKVGELREVGAGISLWANAIRALELVGVGAALRKHAVAGQQGALRTWRGRVLAAGSTAQTPGAEVVVLHRADLLTVLSAEADRVHLNCDCVGFTQDAGGVSARFANGEAVRGDVLIGADGMRSVIRTQLFGDRKPRYSGYTAWRAVARVRNTLRGGGESWGRGRRFGFVPIGDGRVYWFATLNTPEGGRDRPGRAKQDLMELFHGWHEPVGDLIDAAEESAILRNDIYDRQPLKRWTDGRVTLLGDAAHPMTPNLGQGGCQAIEDAVVLAACLKKSAEAGLGEYESRRIPRTSAVVLRSRQIGAMGQMENGLARWLRDAAVWAMPASMANRALEAVTGHEVLTPSERELFGMSR